MDWFIYGAIVALILVALGVLLVGYTKSKPASTEPSIIDELVEERHNGAPRPTPIVVHRKPKAKKRKKH